MSTEYRFLRFESAGIATILFLLISLLPIYQNDLFVFITSDLNAIIGSVAAFFLLSLPVGYIEHQLVVNKYRSHKKPRIIHDILEKIIIDYENDHPDENLPKVFSNLNKKEFISFSTELLEILLHHKENVTNESISERLSSLWSHFYARKAVGIYAPFITLILYIAIIVMGKLSIIPMNLNQNNVIGGLFIVFIFILIGILLIDPYTSKLWAEINYLEAELMLFNFKIFSPKIRGVIYYFMQHPNQIKISDYPSILKCG